MYKYINIGDNKIYWDKIVVVQLDLAGFYINHFPTYKEAHYETGISVPNINRSVKCKTLESGGGYFWMIAYNEDINEIINAKKVNLWQHKQHL